MRWLGIAGTAACLLLVALFLHFLRERRQGELVARHLGEPLAGHGTTPEPAPSAETPRAVWIDTDAACGLGRHVDVDDCFAIAVALAAPELDVRGIGTVFGNAPLPGTDSVARELVSMAASGRGTACPVYRGAAHPTLQSTHASDALAYELARHPLTIIALGPLTNVAAVLDAHPELARRIAEVVFVGGKRAGQWMHPGYDHFLTFSDFNVAQDPAAAARVLASGVPVVLLPFEAALEVTVTPADLRMMGAQGPLGRWLRDRSGEWMAFWRREGGRTGFVPFDDAAVLRVIRPELLRCIPVRGTLETSPPWFGIGMPTELVVRDPAGRPSGLRYCRRADPAFDAFLGERLRAAARLGPSGPPS